MDNNETFLLSTSSWQTKECGLVRLDHSSATDKIKVLWHEKYCPCSNTIDRDAAHATKPRRNLNSVYVGSTISDSDACTTQCGSPWVFVIDYSGSMGLDIAAVQTIVNTLVTNLADTVNEPVSYGLSLFNDPITLNSASEWEASDRDGFVSAINAIYVGGGEDCPEYALDGISNAIPFVHGVKGSYMFLFTDADAKDADIVSTIKSKIRAIEIILVAFISSTCSGTVDDTYVELVDVTGGLLIPTTHTEITSVSEIIESFLSEAVQDIYHISTDSDTLFVQFYIDSSLTSFAVVATSDRGDYPSITLTTPDGNVYSSSESNVEYNSYSGIVEMVVDIEADTTGDTMNGLWTAAVDFDTTRRRRRRREILQVGVDNKILIYGVADDVESSIEFEFSFKLVNLNGYEVDTTMNVYYSEEITYEFVTLRTCAEIVSGEHLLGAVDLIMLTITDNTNHVSQNVTQSSSTAVYCADFLLADLDGLGGLYDTPLRATVFATGESSNDTIARSWAIPIEFVSFSVTIDCPTDKIVGESVAIDLGATTTCSIDVRIAESSGITLVALELTLLDESDSSFYSLSLESTSLTFAGSNVSESTSLTVSVSSAQNIINNTINILITAVADNGDVNYDVESLLVYVFTPSPSTVPSSSPTKLFCDIKRQTDETFELCEWLMLFNDLAVIFNNIGPNLLQEIDYCNIDYSRYTNYFGSNANTTEYSYFECDDSGSIATLSLVNAGINGSLSSEIILAIPSFVQILDLSNNYLEGPVENWGAFSRFDSLNLSNNSFSGNVDFEALSGQSTANGNSSLVALDLSNNYWSAQTIDWRVFEYMPNLERLDLSNNEFAGTIEFQDISNLVFLNLGGNAFSSVYGFDEMRNADNLKEFYFENNFIDEEFDVSWLPDGIERVKCANNTMVGNININDVPTSLIELDCGNNDFGILEWEPIASESSSSFLEYDLEYIDLSNTNLNGKMSMKVFDSDGVFKNLLYVDVSQNSQLNISLNFEYLSAAAMEYLNILGVQSVGSADFGYLTSFIVVKMDASVFCVDSSCADEKNKIVPWTRAANTCVGREGCSATCQCVTEYEAGIYSYDESPFASILFFILLIVAGSGIFCGYLSIGYNKGYFGRKPIARCKRRDDFSFTAVVSYVFQLWDFFSDVLLCYDIYDHWWQEPIQSPDKNIYGIFLFLSATFILVPWFVNLLFLIKVKQDLYNSGTKTASNNIKDNQSKNIRITNALAHSKYKTAKWLNKNAPVLVLLCMLSGGMTASLKLVNSKLFGLNAFDMGLPKYGQDRTARHRIWLTVIMENIPQIFISVMYATLLASFDQTVLLALVSSIASVILAVFSGLLEFPKNYYVYEMVCYMTNNSMNGKIRRQLRRTKLLTFVVSDSLDQDFGFCFIENVFYDGKTCFLFNVVCNEEIDFKINRKQKLNLINNMLSSFKIEIRSFTFKYITHECVDLLSCKDILFNCLCCGCCVCFPCCKKVQFVQNANRRASIKVSKPVPKLNKHIMSNSGNIDMTLSKQGPISPSFGAQTASENENETENEDSTIVYAAPTSPSGEQGAPTRGAHVVNTNDLMRYSMKQNGNSGDWTLWSKYQVSEWIEAVLTTNMFDSEEIDDFMTEFNKHNVNGAILKRFEQDEKILDKFYNALQSHSFVSFGMWLPITDAIKSLKEYENVHIARGGGSRANLLDSLEMETSQFNVIPKAKHFGNKLNNSSALRKGKTSTKMNPKSKARPPAKRKTGDSNAGKSRPPPRPQSVNNRKRTG